MTEAGAPKIKALLLAVAGAGVVFGVFGLLDLRNRASAGIWWGPSNQVIRVMEGSPAEKAGFQLGDVVKSIDGTPISDTRTRVRQPRTGIGQTRVFELERDEEVLEIAVTYGPLQSRQVVLSVADAGIALCFLLFGLWAYFKRPSTATRLLALVGICFGLPIMPAPWLDSFALRAVGEAVSSLLIVFAFALLLHFVLEFPYHRSWLDSPLSKVILYGPATLLVLVFFYLILFQPDTTSGLNTFVSTLGNLFVASYFGVSALAMVRSFRQTEPEKRQERGISFMLLGTLLGMLPLIVSAVARVAFPTFVLPGVEFYALTFTLVPISFALATVKSASAAA